jgi:DNA-binding MarR family transcriptional regulator
MNGQGGRAVDRNAKTAPAASGAGDGWDGQRRTIGGLLVVASRALVADFHRRLDAAGFADVRPGSGNVFESVGSAGSTVAAMAQRAGISPQAMVQVVDYLEGRGYVERAPDPTDRRAKLVRLTERGRAADRAGRAHLQAIEAEWSLLLGEERYASFRAALEDLVAAIEDRSASDRA